MTASQSTRDPVVPAPTGPVIRIADRLGFDARALASEIPADTLRRTRYPAEMIEDGEGRTLWRHPILRQQGA